MGSKLRKLRQKAGVTGHKYQTKQRREARARARRPNVVFQDDNVVVGVNSPGGELKSGQLQAALRGARAPALALGMADAMQSDLLGHALRSGARLEASSGDVLVVDGEFPIVRESVHVEPELAEQIHAGSGVWIQDNSLFHVADYLTPLEGKAFGLGEVCRVCGKTRVKVTAKGYELSGSAASSITAVGECLSPPAAPAPLPSSPASPALSAGAPGFGPPLRREGHGKLGTLLALAMLAGLAGEKGGGRGF